MWRILLSSTRGYIFTTLLNMDLVLYLGTVWYWFIPIIRWICHFSDNILLGRGRDEICSWWGRTHGSLHGSKSVWLRSLKVSQDFFSTHLQLPSLMRTLDSPYTLWLCRFCNMAGLYCGQACWTIGIIRCVVKDTKYCVGPHSPCIWQLYTRPRGQCHIVKTRLVNNGNDSMLCRTHF